MKIHCIEGLFSYYARPLTKAVKSLNLNVEVVTYPWTVKEMRVEDGDICCFHSFGLGAFDLVRTKKNGLKFFILDGRMPKWGTPYNGYPIQNHEIVFNYYQTGFLKGYPVWGAVNHHITGYWHGRMPRNPAFLFKLMEVVKEKK
jgi:hypothetical protein